MKYVPWKQSLGKPQEALHWQVMAVTLAGGRARASLEGQTDAMTGWTVGAGRWLGSGRQKASKHKPRATRAEGHWPIDSPSGVTQQFVNSQLGSQVTHFCLQVQLSLCEGSLPHLLLGLEEREEGS